MKVWTAIRSRFSFRRKQRQNTAFGQFSGIGNVAVDYKTLLTTSTGATNVAIGYYGSAAIPLCNKCISAVESACGFRDDPNLVFDFAPATEIGGVKSLVVRSKTDQEIVSGKVDPLLNTKYPYPAAKPLPAFYLSVVVVEESKCEFWAHKELRDANHRLSTYRKVNGPLTEKDHLKALGSVSE